MVNGNSLVSIVVITYNSGKYVLDTLESAKAQTYRNIELIISDDCSADNTVEICRKWLEENKDRFVRTELITSSVNTGITANCNRGLEASRGEWLKFIAGDDVLIDYCIEKFLCNVNGNVFIACSEIKEFTNINEVTLVKSETGDVVNKTFRGLNDAGQQFIYFLKGFYIPGSGIFLERKKLLGLGGFDEKYRNNEIRPLSLKYTFNDIKVNYLPLILVLHRRHPEAATAKTNKIIAPYLKDAYLAIDSYSDYGEKTILIVNSKWHVCMINLIFSAGNEGIFCRFLNWLRLKFQPLRIYNLLCKINLINE